MCMKDVFLDYEIIYRKYKDKKDLYDKVSLYQLDIFDSMYRNILELQLGNDAMCLDYIKLQDYMNIVAKEFSNIVKSLNEHLKVLEKEKNKFNKDCEDMSFLIEYWGLLSFESLLELFKIFNINFGNVEVNSGKNNERGITIYILENNEFVPYTFWGDIHLVKVNNGNIELDSSLEYLFGSDFIYYYINYIYNYGINKLEDICNEYKKACLNR